MHSQNYYNESIHKIGISKLACAMCHEIIKACKQQNNIKINIKGYHGKVYTKWSYPEEGNLEIYKVALTNIAAQYQMGFLLKYEMLKEEASTNTSMSIYSDDAEQNDEYNFGLNSDQSTLQTKILEHVDKTLAQKYAHILKDLLELETNDKFGYNKTGVKVFDNNRYCWIDDIPCYPKNILEHAQDEHLTLLLGKYNDLNIVAPESWD